MFKRFASPATARSGQLEEFKALRSNGCPWDRMTCMFAAMNGHLEVLQLSLIHI